MSALLFWSPFLEFRNADGTPVAGGTLNTFLAGSATPVNTYSDDTLSTSNGSSILLNTSGQPEVAGNRVGVYGSSAVSYKWQVLDANGAQVPGLLQDNFNLPGGSSGPTIPNPTAPNQVIASLDGATYVATDAPIVNDLTVTSTVTLPAASVALSSIASITQPTSFTSTWGGTGVSIGNGTISGSYSMVGKQVTFWILFQSGSTTNFGSGSWTFTLPVTAANATNTATCLALQFGTGVFVGLLHTTTTTTMIMYAADGMTRFSATSPFAWNGTNGDSMVINGTYVAA